MEWWPLSACDELTGLQARRDRGHGIGECVLVNVVQGRKGHDSLSADSCPAELASVGGDEVLAVHVDVAVEADVVLLQRDPEYGPGDRGRRALDGVLVPPVSDHGHSHAGLARRCSGHEPSRQRRRRGADQGIEFAQRMLSIGIEAEVLLDRCRWHLEHRGSPLASPWSLTVALSDYPLRVTVDNKITANAAAARYQQAHLAVVVQSPHRHEGQCRCLTDRVSIWRRFSGHGSNLRPHATSGSSLQPDLDVTERQVREAPY